jgi:hypothetical protein
MKTILTSLIISFTLSMFSLGQSIYTGVVGNTPVRASLTFANDQVTGTYTSKTSGKTYRLEGDNSIPGVATLIEYTFNGKTKDWTATARVSLRKSEKNGNITWSGTMYNYDGRNVEVRLTRSR